MQHFDTNQGGTWESQRRETFSIKSKSNFKNEHLSPNLIKDISEGDLDHQLRHVHLQYISTIPILRQYVEFLIFLYRGFKIFPFFNKL